MQSGQPGYQESPESLPECTKLWANSHRYFLAWIKFSLLESKNLKLPWVFFESLNLLFGSKSVYNFFKWNVIISGLVKVAFHSSEINNIRIVMMTHANMINTNQTWNNKVEWTFEYVKLFFLPIIWKFNSRNI